jgi:hypothetical protein
MPNDAEERSTAPEMNVPAVVPGQPSLIPEIPLAKKIDQKGVAKIGQGAVTRMAGVVKVMAGMGGPCAGGRRVAGGVHCGAVADDGAVPSPKP